jgi:NAD(P)H-nitrite reductase large subunit
MSHCFVCRCEEVCIDEVKRALEAGARTVNDVKRQTRAGMGLCQGIYCVAEISRLIASQSATTMETISPMTARPPVRLVTLEELARPSE